MGFKCGVVGLPNVGKSTLFNALTKSGIEASNYPFCTIEPNVGVVSVPDPRLFAIEKITHSTAIIPAAMQFVDIAGLIAGASKGEGLGNQFLSHIRETQAIAHVVRCYENNDITHVTGRVDPASDIEIINTELALADLETVEKILLKLAKQVKTGNKDALAIQAVLLKAQATLAEGTAIRCLTLSEAEETILKPYQLLTAKPVLYVANIADIDYHDNPHYLTVQKIAQQENSIVVPLCALLESEIAELDEPDKKEFLADFGLEEPGLHSLIRAGYQLLGLHTFFTAGPKELRAWTIKIGQTASKAAGVIHGDFEKGFIRAEVIGYEDYIRYNGEQGAKNAGAMRLEGKEYIVQDGDVIYFRTNT